MVRSKCLLLILWISIPCWLSAQVNLQGKITDIKSGKAIPYVLVRSKGQIVNSDKIGNYSIQLTKGEQKLRFERMGYFPVEIEFTQQSLAGSVLDVSLEKKPVVMGSIIIEDSPLHSIPQSDEIIDELKRMSQPMDGGDLLRGVSGFAVSKRGAYAQEPVFRSFKQDQINVLFDGFVQYNHACPNRMDPNVTHVIPAEIRKVEIIKGPFSVRYGPSMGATLNYHTESAGTVTSGFAGTVESGYEFNGSGKSGNAALAYTANRFGVFVNGSIKDYEDYQSGSDSIVPAAFSSRDYGVKLGINPSSNQRILLNWRQSFLRDAKYAGLPMDARSDESRLASISYLIKNLHPNLLSVEFKAYGDQVDHVMDNFDRKNFATVEAISTVFADTYGAKLELNLAPAARHLTFGGVDHKLLMRDGLRERLVKKNMMTGADLPDPMFFTDKIWQDSRLSTSGIYLEHKYYPNSMLSLTAGFRADYVQSEINDPAEDFAALYTLDDRKEMNFSGNISAAMSLDKDLSMQLALGRGVRSASIDERYINHFAVGKDPYELVGNPDLKPEINHQIEFSLRKQSPKWDVRFNAFYSRFSQLITAALDSTLARKYSPWLEPKFAKRYVNVEEACQTGVELGVDYRFTKHFKVHGQFAYTYAQNLSWDEPISRVPPMEAGLDLRYEMNRWWASVNGRFVAHQNRVAPSFGEVETPGFNLFNARIGIKPIKGLIVGLTVENLLDRDYVEFLNWSFNPLIGEGLVLEPGRNISFYARYSF